MSLTLTDLLLDHISPIPLAEFLYLSGNNQSSPVMLSGHLLLSQSDHSMSGLESDE